MVTIVSKRIRRTFHEALTTAECPANNAARFPINVRHGFREILLEGGTTDDIFMHMVPAIRQMWFYDSSAALGTRWFNMIWDKDKTIINRHVAGITFAGGSVAPNAGDFWYFGMAGKIKGFRFDVGTANGTDTGEIPTMEYSAGPTWRSTTIVDTTDGATDGQMFAADGLITISSVPSDWESTQLNKLVDTKDLPPDPVGGERLYWLRLTLPFGTAAMDAATTLLNVAPMAEILANSLTTDGDATRIKPDVEYSIPIEIPATVGALEFVSSTTTGRLPGITWIAR